MKSKETKQSGPVQQIEGKSRSRSIPSSRIEIRSLPVGTTISSKADQISARSYLAHLETQKKNDLNVGTLFSSILSKDLLAFKALLDDPETDLNQRDQDGLTPLHYAVALGARPWIRLLVASGKCDFLVQDNFGRYASDIAVVWSRDYAVARLLAKHQLRQAAQRGVKAWKKPKKIAR